MAFAGPAAGVPDGWHLCDGSVHGITDPQFHRLFTVVGYSHGGSGENFRLPDYRGLFLRGVSHNRDDGYEDPNVGNRTVPGDKTADQVGSLQFDQFGNHDHDKGTLEITSSGQHKHTVFALIGAWLGTKTNIRELRPTSQKDNVKTASASHTHPSSSFKGRVGHTGGSETRPKNAYVNWIIRL